MRKLLALRQVLKWKFHQVCSNIVLCVGKLGTSCHNLLFPGPTGDVQCFSGAGDMSTEAEVMQKRRQKRAVITRRFVPLMGEQPGPVDFGSHELSRELFEQALTIVTMSPDEDTLSLVPCGFFISLRCLDHFLVDPAMLQLLPLDISW